MRSFATAIRNRPRAQELLESAERKIFGVAEDQIRGETLELKEVVKKAMDEIALRADWAGTRSRGFPRGWSTSTTSRGGFTPASSSSWRPGPRIGGARPSRSTSATTSAINLKIPSLFISLEMGHLEIGERLFVH